jgi:hypothetical protein
VTRIDGHSFRVQLDHVGGTGSLQLNLAAAGSGITDTAGNALPDGMQGERYVVGGVLPVILPPEPPMPVAPVSTDTTSVSLLEPITHQDLPTIYFGDAAPPRSFELPVEIGNGVLDGLSALEHARQESSVLATPVPAFPATVIEAGHAFSVPLQGVEVLQANMGDGRPLPAWLVFDPVAGSLSGIAPHDFNGVLVLQLTVRDAQGHVREIPLQLSAARTPVPADRATAPHDGKPAATAKPALATQFGTQRHATDHAAMLRQLAAAQRHAASAQVQP